MDSMNSKQLATAFGWGVVATIAMSIPMVIASATGASPMPAPIPKALVGLIFGSALPLPVHMALAVISHLAYGGIWAVILVAVIPRVTLWHGVGLSVILWLIMELIVLPLLGWGVFGIAVTPAIALATLILHLVYGFTLGWLLSRGAYQRATAEPAAA